MTMENEIMKSGGEIVLYQRDEVTNLEVKVESETVWLTAAQMSLLFDKEDSNIRRHILNIFKEGELARENNVHFLHVNGVKKPVPFYSLDVIISVGYRVKSARGVQFRIWANKVLKDYLLRGYSLNRHLIALQERSDERFAQIEQRLDDQRQKVEFLVKAHTIPQENLFATGCVWDAYAYVCDLVRSAKGRIVLIDNFVDDRVLKILDKRSAGVTATVHTRYTEQLELDLAKHNEQCAPIERVQLPIHIHDRFLIVDDDVYLLGPV